VKYVNKSSLEWCLAGRCSCS